MTGKQDHSKTAEKLERVIKKHCKKVRPDAIPSFANHILVCEQNSEYAAGVSRDLDSLNELKKLLSKASGMLVDLSETARRNLNYNIPRLETETPKTPRNDFELLAKAAGAERSLTANNGLLKVRISTLKSLETGIDKTLEDETVTGKASVKRNYRAALVAGACRKIWRENLPEGKEPPKSIHADRFPPFRLFVEDIFDVLSIGSTAPSALDSLAALGGEENLVLSVDVG